ncbi:MAG: preprotein translocase subunit SecG [Lysobacterales bacterium]|jgi:preprotein translocase subunit SecG
MQVLNIFHVLIAIAMVAFILVQRGAGATAGAAFGSGASGTVFGSRGAGSFLSRTTWILALFFCSISLSMAVIVSRTVSTPDTDLGVIGSAQIQEPVSDGNPLDLPALDDPGQDSDLPVLDTSGDTSSEALPQGDLPQVDAESLSVPETEDDAGSDDDTGDDPSDG